MNKISGMHHSYARAFVFLVFLCIFLTHGRLAAALPDPNQGPGGPILVIKSGNTSFGSYYAEILRTEGFNEFAVAEIGSVTSTTLASYDVVILASIPLSASQATMLSNWVTNGGNLIAMRPDAQLANLLGLAPGAGTLANGYLLIDTSSVPGNGLVGQTIQFHGVADLYTLNGASSLATLYSNPSTAISHPAVSLRTVGSGKAAAFAYDLATSIVYTRQGNPAWAMPAFDPSAGSSPQERDGLSPIRSDDKFYGNASFDPQPDWVDLNKVAVPQADEQQRLLANLILEMNRNKKPLPRFWYFPNGKKAAVIMTGDDHANGGTGPRFDQFIAASPSGCSVANWECVRGTSYIFPNTPLTNTQAAAYTAQGFEVGLHLNTNCADFTPSALEAFYVQQIADFTSKYPSLPAPLTQRHHCIAWTDWVTGAKVQLNHGIRLDTSYYYWPPGWVLDRPGHFTGSAMPMRFSDTDGTLIDVYNAASQITDESGQSFPFTIDALLDKAVGPEGYYGAITVNAHTDAATSSVADAVVSSAQARGIPIVSSRQMMDWLDARNSSSFSGLAWNGATRTLSFTITPASGAVGLQALVPATAAGGAVLAGITRSGSPVAFSTQTIKGRTYAAFGVAAGGGQYVATYAIDTTPPTVSSTNPSAGATGVSPGTTVAATFSEAIDPSTVNANTFQLRDSANALVAATVGYDGVSRVATLTPGAVLAYGATYTATVKGGANGVKDPAGNALAADFTWSFTTASAPACPCSAWSSTAVPGNPSVSNDPNAVELGVKFRTSVNGYITGIRFYKGSNNTGTHIGNLWSASGQNLATATFTNETASGWQQVNFASPVPIQANTTYIASYFAPAGGYAADSSYFASSGVDSDPIHLLKEGVDGGNGVYSYGASSGFPSSSFQSTNYWVDVVFATGAADTTPPTVTGTSPVSGATGVATTSTVTASFSEAIQTATVTTTSFALRDASNNAVAATVSASGNTATLTPSTPLSAGATYTAILKSGASGVKDLAGNALAADVTWSFTTAVAGAPNCGSATSIWPSNPTPSVPADSDTGSVELGVKFRTSVNGYICGLRFYKGSGNTGTHVGTLWTASGQQLARATFTNETASGWQQVSFATPVAVTANTLYVASYHAPAGHYAADGNYFASGVTSGSLYAFGSAESSGNGVYLYGSGGFPVNSFNATNYWVDVLFTSNTGPDTTPPTVTQTSPAAGATGVNPTAAVVKATFSEPVDPATINGSTFELRDSGNNLVAGTVAYNSSALTATLTPSAPLAGSALYSVRLKGGALDPRIKDLAGNALAADFTWNFTTGTDPCTSSPNPIVRENCLAGNLASEWDIAGAGDTSIQGYATDISVNKGETVRFKINTPSTDYRLDIYRMGYYRGRGARKVATVQPSAILPQVQPNCLNDSATGLTDCGNWAQSAAWTVPSTAVSGIYFAKAVREDGVNAGKASHIFFVVRDDASTSDLLFQTSDTTWQAYNNYGGNSLYTGSPVGRAYKVSYNRPFNTRAVDGGQDWVFNAEYPMVRWLEANGYSVSYFTGVDSDRRGNLIRNHKVFLSVGHDEYWSAGQRANVEAARNAGVHLAFFSGNEIFWKTRWETSIDGSGTSYRTLVCYKETHAGAKIDPLPNVWTGTWRDPRFSPPADGGQPENALSGTIFMVNEGATTAITVPEVDGKMRFWRNTSIATQAANAAATLAGSTLGYEWDVDLDNGFRPAGLIALSTTTVANAPVLQDYGSTYSSGTAVHHLTLYKHGSGALVFGAGTVQWVWGLDSNHDRGNAPADPRMQQATVNLLADMGAQPATLEAGLVAATASTDAAAPTSTISSPAAGATVQSGSAVTISGTAADTGGGVVGGVEVSVDGGVTWHPATGRAAWNYTWIPSGSGSVTIKSRATDDSGNIETPNAGATINVGSGSGSQTCPCSLWSTSATPTVASDSDTGAVELGIKFRSDSAGFITGIRFYKGSRNTGTHTGSLWTISGQLLATATFTNETTSGWQQVNFATPVAITANTVYVASYHAPNGGYAVDSGYFAAAGYDNAPLHALADLAGGGNGVYLYGAGGFPTQSYQATNYWVDVVFTSNTSSDSSPPNVTMTAPSNGASVSGTAVAVSANASDNVGVASVQFLLDGVALGSPDTNSPYNLIWDTTRTTNGSHTLSARAIDATNNIATSAAVSVTVSNPPASPSALTAAAAPGTQINLSWTDNSVNETGLKIERCQGLGCSSFSQIATVAANVTRYADTAGLTANTAYTYRVRAYNSVADSAYSNTASATTLRPPVNTGFLSPSANQAAVGGDNNGFQTNSTNAYTSDGLFAMDTDSGTNTNTSCGNTGKDKHIYYNYNFNLPAGAIITGIEVRLDAQADSTTGAPKICAQLSWNGGSSWTALQSTATLTTSKAIYILGNAINTWGRTWIPTNFSNANFRVRLIDVASNTNRDFSLDWIAVRVTYQ